MTAAAAAWKGSKWGTPSQQASWVKLGEVYQTRWAYYNNEVFEKDLVTLNNWLIDRQRDGLYRNIRPVINPTMALVERYVQAVYPGVLATDGEELPDGVPLALPLSKQTPDALREAVAQLWQWSNFGLQLELIVRWGAALGDVFAEVVDDVARRKVYYDVIWPGHLVDLILDRQSNVKAYTLEYQVRDEETGAYFLYRKEVTKTEIRTFKDGEPFGFDGNAPAYANPYGFVPAVWFMHRNVGAENGAPAMHGCYNKVARIMSLVTRINDQVMKIVGAPAVIATSGKWKDGTLKVIASGATGPTKRSDDAANALDVEGALLIQAPADTHVESLLAQLDFSGVLAYIDKLLDDIAQTNPLLRVWDELRQMSQVTGPAANRLTGDGSGAVLKAQAAYDVGVIKLLQMGVAIAGEHASKQHWQNVDPFTGAAEPLTEQQQKFLPFDLDSYDEGKLDFTILPRPLMPETGEEVAASKSMKYAAIKAGTDAGLPLEVVLDEEGWDAKKIRAVVQAKEKAARDAAAIFTSEAAPSPAPQSNPNQGSNQQPGPAVQGSGTSDQQAA